MAEACRALGVPVVSGNVSLYNETDGRSILPTPTVAMVGVIADLGDIPAAHFRRAGRRVVLLGEDRGEFGGSAYLRLLHGIEAGRPPAIELSAEARLARLLVAAAAQGLLRTAHDLSEGGLAVALAEATFTAGVGARLTVPLSPTDLFSESQARAVVACAPRQLDRFLELAAQHGVPALEAGETGGDRLVIEADGATIDAAVADLRAAWSAALPLALGL
jgi:phosphoribosylformylglycinamidine synthase